MNLFNRDRRHRRSCCNNLQTRISRHCNLKCRFSGRVATSGVCIVSGIDGHPGCQKWKKKKKRKANKNVRERKRKSEKKKENENENEMH